MVASGLYNPDRLAPITNGMRKMTFWQNIDDPYTIDAKPAYLNTTTGNIDVAGSDVKVENIIGCLFDRDALGMVKRSTWALQLHSTPQAVIIIYSGIGLRQHGIVSMRISFYFMPELSHLKGVDHEYNSIFC